MGILCASPNVNLVNLLAPHDSAQNFLLTENAENISLRFFGSYW